MKKTPTEKKLEQEEFVALHVKKNNQEEEKPFDFQDFEFKTLEDFEIYNREVRKFNRTCSHERNKMKIKVPTEEFHKKVKVRFQRFDQESNVLKARVRNKEIDWTGQLIPGGVHELPIPVVKYLNRLATPVFEEVEVKDGSGKLTETVQVGEKNRFSCTVLDFE